MKHQCEKCTKQKAKFSGVRIYSGYYCSAGNWDARGMTKTELDDDTVTMDFDPWLDCLRFAPINFGL